MSLVKDHEIAQLVNLLTSTAKTYGHTQQLREHISATVIHFLEEHNLREKTCTTPTTTPTHLKNPAQETPPTAAEKAPTEQTDQIKKTHDSPLVKAYLVNLLGTSAVFLEKPVATDYAVKHRGVLQHLVSMYDYQKLHTAMLELQRRIR